MFYRSFQFFDAKVVLLLIPLSVGDDVERCDDDGDQEEDCHAADDQDCHPSN